MVQPLPDYQQHGGKVLVAGQQAGGEGIPFRHGGQLAKGLFHQIPVELVVPSTSASDGWLRRVSCKPGGICGAMRISSSSTTMMARSSSSGVGGAWRNGPGWMAWVPKASG